MYEDGKMLWQRVFNKKNFPIILQSEASECGLACLCMILNYYNQKTTLPELRRKYSISMKGTSLKSIVNIADSVGMTPRPLRLETEYMKKLKTPCILHWDMNHFVVLTLVNSSGIEIVDPARGKRKVGHVEIDKSFSGVALELTPNARFEKKDYYEKLLLSDMWSNIIGLSSFLWQLGILAFAVQFLAILSPILNQLILDEAITKGDLNLLHMIAIGLILLYIFQAIISLFQSFVGLYLGTQLSLQMKTNLIKHALKLPVSWFEKRHIGDILSRFNSLEPIQKFITEVPVNLALHSIMAIVSLFMMTIYSRVLAFIVIITLAIPIIIRLIVFPFIKQKTDEGITLASRANTVFMETIRGVRSFKLFGKEQDRIIQWQNEQVNAINNSVTIEKYTIYGVAGLALITNLQNVALWFLGANFVINGTMSLGMLIAFQTYAIQFSGAAKGIGGIFFQWKTIDLHLERLADIIHEDFEELTTKVNQTSIAMEGRICARNISFRYASNEPFLLQNVNIEINPGEFVAIVGASGGGKTTFMKLLLGILPPSEGEIIVEGIGMVGFGLRNFRLQVSSVLQDDRLFQGTITDNVSFFDNDVDISGVEESLKQACVYDEILKMPMGLETLVGDLGTTLSGGQIQRVLIARALYRKPKILFLDEGTAHLDTETERNLTANLRDLKITRIAVAHREVAIEGADRIFKVENGKVEEIT